jgi:hypothetical protein
MTDAPPTRAELDQLFREHDRYMAEVREGERRKAAREALMRKTSDDVSEHPDQDENPSTAISVAGSDETAAFDERQTDLLESLVEQLWQQHDHEVDLVIAELRAEFRQEIENLANRFVRMVYPGERAEREVYEMGGRMLHMEAKLREFGGDLIEAKGLLGDVLRKHAARALPDNSVIDLPNWRRTGAA